MIFSKHLGIECASFFSMSRVKVFSSFIVLGAGPFRGALEFLVLQIWPIFDLVSWFLNFKTAYQSFVSEGFYFDFWFWMKFIAGLQFWAICLADFRFLIGPYFPLIFLCHLTP